MVKFNKITIFTPSYNRGYILGKLYESLCKQTVKAFIWLIVDDGSTDNTEFLIRKWIKEKRIEIQYYRQENKGKAQAHNEGVGKTKTELFCCVDSDDSLVSCAIECILIAWESNKDCIGMMAYRGNEKEIYTKLKYDIKKAKLRDLYGKYKMTGDTMLIYKTELLKLYKFPFFENENFVPEAYIYDQLDLHGDLYIIPKVLYLCNYLEDGYTKNIRNVIKNNPKGYLCYIVQRLKSDTHVYDKVMNTLKYIAVSFCIERHGIIRNSVYPGLTLLGFIPGYLVYVKLYRNE